MWVRESKMTEPRNHSLKIGLVRKAFSSLVDHHSVRATQLDDAGKVEFRLSLPVRERNTEPEEKPHIVANEMDCAADFGCKRQSIAGHRGRALRHPAWQTLKGRDQFRVRFVSTGGQHDTVVRAHRTGTYDDAAHASIFHHESLRRYARDDRDASDPTAP